MFLLMALVILSLLVPIFFFCSVSAYFFAAGSKVMNKNTIFAEFFVTI
jgi:hypothetical protein